MSGRPRKVSPADEGMIRVYGKRRAEGSLCEPDAYRLTNKALAAWYGVGVSLIQKIIKDDGFRERQALADAARYARLRAKRALNGDAY